MTKVKLTAALAAGLSMVGLLSSQAFAETVNPVSGNRASEMTKSVVNPKVSADVKVHATVTPKGVPVCTTEQECNEWRFHGSQKTFCAAATRLGYHPKADMDPALVGILATVKTYCEGIFPPPAHIGNSKSSSHSNVRSVPTVKSSSSRAACAPILCKDGRRFDSCTADGHVINYFANPCTVGVSSSSSVHSSSSSSVSSSASSVSSSSSSSL